MLDGAAYFGGTRKFRLSLYEKCEEMEIILLALTVPQLRRFKPPSRPVNQKDSRVKEYARKYGNRCWEVEAIRPRTLYRLIEQRLKEAVLSEFLLRASYREKAARLAKLITERWRKKIETETFRLLEAGVPQKETLALISEKYNI